MEKEYEEIYVPLGYDVSDAVRELLNYRKQGKLASMKFNNVMLYSDTVTMDSAYLQITGKTKDELDLSRIRWQEEYDKELEDHKRKIPELTNYWIKKGNEVIAKDKQKLWAECVPIRLDDLYRGMELGNCLDIVEILNDGGTLEKAKEEINNQDHSGMSYGLVRSMVRAFAERGTEFYEFID